MGQEPIDKGHSVLFVSCLSVGASTIHVCRGARVPDRHIDVAVSYVASGFARGMITPFVLGALLGWYFFNNTNLFPEKTKLSEACLFLGASMCITAFPMLARIIHFKGLAGTLMGTVAIGAGAIDDVMAWCLLALVLASFDANLSQAYWSIGAGAGFVLVAVFVVRPLMGFCQRWMIEQQNKKLTDSGLIIGLAWMALGAWFTDKIHLHAVFGAFVMGACMPRGVFAKELIDRIQPLAVALLLPLFFT